MPARAQVHAAGPRLSDVSWDHRHFGFHRADGLIQTSAQPPPAFDFRHTAQTVALRYSVGSHAAGALIPWPQILALA